MPPNEERRRRRGSDAKEEEAGSADSPVDAARGARPTAREVAACQFSSWYPAFRDADVSSVRENNYTRLKARRSVTIESAIIRPLPADFVEYLLSDGVRLPTCAERVSSCMGDGHGDDGWDATSSEGEDESGEGAREYSFPALTDQIQAALSRLGGGAGIMPKLNWSSPRDAAWMNCGSLRCATAGDVYLLLKSSDFVGFDLERAWHDLAEGELDAAAAESGAERGEADGRGAGAIEDEGGRGPASSPAGARNRPPGFEYELVLRKWCNLHPSMEFRCFVRDHELVAVSQRHPTKFYSHLQPPDDGSVHPTLIIIDAFFRTYVRRRFAGGEVGRYVVDLYVDSRERCWIVDFNVWGDRTDGLLFDWGELTALGEAQRVDGGTREEEDEGSEEGSEEGADDMPEMRVVTRDMKSMTYDPLSSYRGPTDVVGMLAGGEGGEGAPSFQEFMRRCVRPSDI